MRLEKGAKGQRLVFQPTELVNLTVLRDMSLLFRLEDGSWLTMTCEMPEHYHFASDVCPFSEEGVTHGD